MGKRYYCDYCDRSFKDDPEARKKHISSLQHVNKRSEYYRQFKDKIITLVVQNYSDSSKLANPRRARNLSMTIPDISLLNNLRIQRFYDILNAGEISIGEFLSRASMMIDPIINDIIYQNPRLRIGFNLVNLVSSHDKIARTIDNFRHGQASDGDINRDSEDEIVADVLSVNSDDESHMDQVDKIVADVLSVNSDNEGHMDQVDEIVADVLSVNSDDESHMDQVDEIEADVLSVNSDDESHMDQVDEVVADVFSVNSDDKSHVDQVNEIVADAMPVNSDDVINMDSDADDEVAESNADTVIIDFNDYLNPDVNGADVACSLQRDVVIPTDFKNAISSEICMTCMDTVPNVYYKPCGHCTFCAACHKKMFNNVLSEGSVFVCQICCQQVHEVFIIEKKSNIENGVTDNQ